MDLWGPDELERMKHVGNIQARKLYRDTKASPRLEVSNAVWRMLLLEKYGKQEQASLIDLDNDKKKIILQTMLLIEEKRSNPLVEDYDFSCLQSKKSL